MLGVARHLTTDQIAHETGYSTGTVNVYCSSALRKLHANSRRHAAQILMRDYPALFNEVKLQPASFEPSPPSVFLRFGSRLPWPWPTRGSRTNDRSIIEKLFAFAIAIAIMLATAALYLGAVAALGSRF